MAESTHTSNQFVLGVLQSVGGSLVTTIASAIWQHMKNGSIDWLAISGLFALMFIVFFFLWFFGKSRKTKSIQKSAIDTALTSLAQDCEEIAEETKRAGAQASLLWHFRDQARHLERLLTLTQHHWDNAGEKLSHPIAAKSDWKDWNRDDCIPLTRELVNFGTQYDSHLAWLRIAFPGFESSLIQHGIPSEIEYPDLIMLLKGHADLLGSLAQSIWDTGSPEYQLNAKQSRVS